MSRRFTNSNELTHETLKENDIVYIASIRHIVTRSRHYYLGNPDGSNSEIFNIIKVDKIYLLESMGYRDLGGDFPEFDNAVDFTHYVRAIMQFSEGLIKDFGNIRFSDSFVQFLRDGSHKSKICKILIENTNVLDTNKINYITNRYDEYISYMPSNKIQEINEDGTWSRKNRQQGKPAKIIKQLFTPELLELVTDSDFEIFANLYKSINDKQGKFKIVSGDEIKSWYSEDVYKSNQASLNNSCMRYDNCQKFFGLYTKNPTNIKMLILVDDVDLLLGRALLWHTEDGINLMDRIYGSDSTIEKFKMWGYDNDYYIKNKNNNSTSCSFINKNGEEKFDFLIKLPNLEHKSYPYMDTFCFMDIDKTALTNNAQIYLDGYELRSTNGDILSRAGDDDDDYERTCYVSGRTVYTDDDAVYIESIGEYVHVDYAVYCNHEHLHILERYSFECEFSGNTYHRDYGVEIIGGGIVYENHADLVSLGDGRYCRSGEALECAHDNSIYHKSDIVSIEVNEIEYFVHVNNVENFKAYAGRI